MDIDTSVLWYIQYALRKYLSVGCDNYAVRSKLPYYLNILRFYIHILRDHISDVAPYAAHRFLV